MKTILFPTDFSDCANNALAYAIEFAQKFNSKLIIHNSCHVLSQSAQFVKEDANEDDIYDESIERIQTIIDKTSLKGKKNSYEIDVRFGFAVENIESISQ